ncbi:MAG: mechanosensitive ion channel family protein [Candidatus Nanoarchaeia archaeon]
MFEQYIANNYLRSLAVLVVFLFVIRVVLFLIQRVALKLTSKTKTDIDDKLIKKSSTPLTIIAFLVGLRVAQEELLLIESVNNLVSNIIYSILVIFLAYLIYIVIDLIVIKAIKKVTKKTKSNIDDSIISLFQSVLQISIIAITALYILSLWGIQIGPLLAGLGIAGLAVALALQPILSNIFSGASMVFDQTIHVGDLVYLDTDTRGKIEKIGLRSTRIRSFDNELFIVPNNKLSESIIQNVALPEPKSRAVVPFGVSYGTDIDKVKRIITAEIKKISHVEKDPEPITRFLEMADSSINFKVYFYVDSFENRFNCIDEANTRIYNALNKAGIEIPFPQRDVHMKKD